MYSSRIHLLTNSGNPPLSRLQVFLFIRVGDTWLDRSPSPPETFAGGFFFSDNYVRVPSDVNASAFVVVAIPNYNATTSPASMEAASRFPGALSGQAESTETTPACLENILAAPPTDVKDPDATDENGGGAAGISGGGGGVKGSASSASASSSVSVLAGGMLAALLAATTSSVSSRVGL
jgi:hypothetical protein